MTIIARLLRASGLFLCLSFLSLLPFLGGLWVFAAEPVEIKIQGIEGKPLENVEATLRTPPGIVQPDGAINLPLLQRFERDTPQRVRQALEPFGYYESQVETDLRKMSGDVYELVVRVHPGEPVRVGGVRVNIEGPGELEAELTRLVRRFSLQGGDILRQDSYEKAKARIQSRAVDLGYLDADFTTHLISVNLAEKKADIELILATGNRYFFDGVTFSGTDSYPNRFLGRYLAFKPGDPFSYPKLGETQVNLRNSERFRDILVTADKKVAQNYQVPVDIKLTDAPSKRLRIGAGYQTDTGPRFSLLYQDLNILNRGHEFDAELNIAGLIQGMAARYVVPSSKSPQSYTVFKVNLQREDVPAYTTYLGMFEIDRERSLGEGRKASGFVRFLYEDSDIGGERSRAYLTVPGVRFAVQRYNNPIRPTRGYSFSGELRGTTKFLASDQTFIQFVSQGAYLRKIFRNFTLHTRVQIGMTVQKESINDLPATLRFFAGGDRSVRGYAYQSLGPKNEEGEVIGGKNLVVGSVELERAVGKDWGIAAFYDAGNAFNDFAQVRLSQGVGLGVRYYTRVGPIKLDIARPLDKGAPVVRLHLSFGIGA
jgi:translocation and assembly module TamA